MSIEASQLTRRHFLHGAAAGMAALPLLLEACGSAAPAASPSTAASGGAAPASSVAAASTAAKPSATTGLKLPTHVAFQGATPAFPASADGVVPPGYDKFPTNLVQTVPSPIGKGDDVSLFSYVTTGPVPPVDQNPGWQQLNKAMGLNLKFDTVLFADYFTKLATLVAGNDLTDFFLMNYQGTTIPSELQFLESKCADLTPFLSGDAVKNFPNLATFTASAWKPALINNKIYGVPKIINAVGLTLLMHQSIFDAIGVTEFKNADDFAKVLKDVTKPGGMYGIGGIRSEPSALGWFLGMFRAPLNWKVQNGKFTKDLETPEYKAAIAWLRDLWDKQIVHPDSPSMDVVSAGAGFVANKYTMYPSNFAIALTYWDRTRNADPNFKLRPINAFGFDGGAPYQFQTGEVQGLAVLKKASDARIKQILDTINYLSAPFGSQEYMTVNYGVKGTDWDFDNNGNPAFTKQGQAEFSGTPWKLICAGPPFNYSPTFPDFASVWTSLETKVHSYAVTDPSLGLYSPTFSSKGALLDKQIGDGVNQILFGRDPVSSLDQLIKDWQNNGGNQIRGELEQALQAAG